LRRCASTCMTVVGWWSWTFCQAAAYSARSSGRRSGRCRSRRAAGPGCGRGSVRRRPCGQSGGRVAGRRGVPGSGRANGHSGPCRYWPSALRSRSVQRRDGRNQREPAIEAQRGPAYRRGTTACGPRTGPAIHASTSTAPYRTCRPTRRHGEPRQFASVATGMPSSSATSAACNSSPRQTLAGSPAANLRGVPRPRCVRGTRAGVLDLSSTGGIRRDRLGPVGDRRGAKALVTTVPSRW